jgi:hypothetical protein
MIRVIQRWQQMCAQESGAVYRRAGPKPTMSAAGEAGLMTMQQYVVRRRERHWEVWLGDCRLSGQPSYDEALNLAEALAYAAVQRGEPSRIMIGTVDGDATEFPILPPPRRSATDLA